MALILRRDGEGCLTDANNTIDFNFHVIAYLGDRDDTRMMLMLQLRFSCKIICMVRGSAAAAI